MSIIIVINNNNNNNYNNNNNNNNQIISKQLAQHEQGRKIEREMDDINSQFTWMQQIRVDYE